MIRINFLKYRRLFYVFTLIVLAGTPILLATRSLSPGLDFTGGSEFLVETSADIDAGAVRKSVPAAGDLEVVRVLNPGHDTTHARYRIRTHHTPRQSRDAGHQIAAALNNRFPGSHSQLLSSDSVGPVVGASLRNNTIWALLWSAVVILAYMWFRFELRPGIASTLALVHDALFVLAMFSLTGFQVDLSVMAALLTALGYSMNDSIVILDRVRENLQLRPNATLEDAINLSLNQCLARTMYTSLTVLLILSALFLSGPASLHGFVLAMTAGVVTGTLSTVTVVCPVLVDWDGYSPRHR